LRRARYRAIGKREFITDLRTAIENRVGYAVGKIGWSPQYWMYYEILLGKESSSGKVKEFEKSLRFHGLKQSGVFPDDPYFYLHFNKFYVEHVRNLDCLGICYYPWERELIHHYRLRSKLIYYPDLEPDRSLPVDENRCYLQYFRGKRILLVCPFGELLKRMATREIFEGVWCKTGKKWFYPMEVAALEFGYGFSGETQRKYSTAIDLFQQICEEIDRKEFDIALIAAAGLAIPIASHVKAMGRVAIDLGGHLQWLFGVIGNRIRERADWKRYFNEHWIDMPEKYRPKEAAEVCDSGAYW